MYEKNKKKGKKGDCIWQCFAAFRLLREISSNELPAIHCREQSFKKINTRNTLSLTIKIGKHVCKERRLQTQKIR